MDIIKQEVDVGANGFTKELDIFGRAKFGQTITDLCLNCQSSIVLAIDADWGQGKSTFLKMWANQHKENFSGVTIIDAFENDYQESPYLVIASEIYSLLKSQSSDANAAIFKEKAIAVGSHLLKAGLKGAIKITTANLITADDIEKGIHDAIESFDSSISTAIADHIEENETRKQTIIDLKKFLQGLGVDEDGTPKPPYIFLMTI